MKFHIDCIASILHSVALKILDIVLKSEPMAIIHAQLGARIMTVANQSVLLYKINTFYTLLLNSLRPNIHLILSY